MTDEIEAALRAHVKRLQSENESLRLENETLKRRVSSLEADREINLTPPRNEPLQIL